MNRHIASAALLLSALATQACWYPEFLPESYLTCRIPQLTAEVNADDMVASWRPLLPGVSDGAIKKMLYEDGGYTMDQLRGGACDGALHRAITADGGSILEYVDVMRDVRHFRESMNDPWYYYYSGDPKLARLDSLADICLQRSKAGPLSDRYAVQAARALLSLRSYQRIDSLAGAHRFSDSCIEDIFRQTHASAMYRTGRYDEALEIYKQYGDAVSAKWCLQKLGQYTDKLSLIEALDKGGRQNFPMVRSMLQDYIRDTEASEAPDTWWVNPDPRCVERLIRLSTERSKASGQRDIWLYVQAFGRMTFLKEYERADSLLALIGSSEPELRNSVRVLRFLAQCNTRPYNDEYLKWFTSEAEWLIGKGFHVDGSRPMTTCLWNDEYYGPGLWSPEFSRNTHCSVDYYTDMLHKATDAYVVPRLLDNGDTVSALQLLDIVDYAGYSLPMLRRFDSHGVASVCFALEVGADPVVHAIDGTGNNEHVRRLWLENGSIRNADRWNDLAGTALLAEGRYPEAVEFLKKVSSAYAGARSEEWYDTDRNPFSLKFISDSGCRDKDTRMPRSRNYKLWFAEKMAALEQATDAESKMLYGVGMANSTYPCWSLTRYGQGTTLFPWRDSNAPDETLARDIAHDFNAGNYFESQERLSAQDRRLLALRKNGHNIINRYVTEIPDRERAASLLKEMGCYRTVKHRFEDTAVAEATRRSCDRWSDW